VAAPKRLEGRAAKTQILPAAACMASGLGDNPKPMQLQDMLYTQGFGTRRVCAGLEQQGLARWIFEENRPLARLNTAQAAIENIAFDLQDGQAYEVQGQRWQYFEKAYVLLHKRAGYECSHKPGAWPSVYTLLPSPLRTRPCKGAIQGVQAVGRLDQDTTGLLLLSDDGAFIHRMSSPKHHVPKIYQVLCKHAVDDQQIAKLLAGVVLDDSPKPVRAAACQQTGEHALDLTLTEGKYHQVKRMLAAVGNRVEGLHRSQMGGLTLGDLQPGQWRWLSAADLDLLKPPTSKE
jgi:16S rRNA pseudouridine516 synthase